MNEEPKRDPADGPPEDAGASNHESEVDTGKGQAGPGPDGMSEEEFKKQLQEQMRRISVEDVVLQTTVTLVNLGFHRLGLSEETKGDRDLDQAKLAIDAINSLMGLVESSAGEQAQALKDALSQLQLNYVRLADEEENQEKGEKTGKSDDKTQPTESKKTDETGGSKKSKLWTPPGS